MAHCVILCVTLHVWVKITVYSRANQYLIFWFCTETLLYFLQRLSTLKMISLIFGTKQVLIYSGVTKGWQGKVKGWQK